MFEGLPIYMYFGAPPRVLCKASVGRWSAWFPWRRKRASQSNENLQLLGALKHRPLLAPTFRARSASEEVQCRWCKQSPRRVRAAWGWRSEGASRAMPARRWAKGRAWGRCHSSLPALLGCFLWQPFFPKRFPFLLASASAFPFAPARVRTPGEGTFCARFVTGLGRQQKDHPCSCLWAQTGSLLSLEAPGGELVLGWCQ